MSIAGYPGLRPKREVKEDKIALACGKLHVEVLKCIRQPLISFKSCKDEYLAYYECINKVEGRQPGFDAYIKEQYNKWLGPRSET